MYSWLDSQRLSLQILAAHLAAQGFGDEIAPTIAKGQALAERRFARVAEERAKTEQMREDEIRRSLEARDL